MDLMLHLTSYLWEKEIHTTKQKNKTKQNALKLKTYLLNLFLTVLKHFKVDYSLSGSKQ